MNAKADNDRNQQEINKSTYISNEVITSKFLHHQALKLPLGLCMSLPIASQDQSFHIPLA